MGGSYSRDYTVLFLSHTLQSYPRCKFIKEPSSFLFQAAIHDGLRVRCCDGVGASSWNWLAAIFNSEPCSILFCYLVVFVLSYRASRSIARCVAGRNAVLLRSVSSLMSPIRKCNSLSNIRLLCSVVLALDLSPLLSLLLCPPTNLNSRILFL